MRAYKRKRCEIAEKGNQWAGVRKTREKREKGKHEREKGREGETERRNRVEDEERTRRAGEEWRWGLGSKVNGCRPGKKLKLIKMRVTWAKKVSDVVGTHFVPGESLGSEGFERASRERSWTMGPGRPARSDANKSLNDGRSWDTAIRETPTSSPAERDTAARK